jgi:2-octaprenyl-6-methoxyphenol hydroxylase
VDLIAPARACAIARDPGAMRVEVEGEAGRRSLRARLLVVADGGRSRLRDWLGIRVARHAYGQSAVIANVTPARDHAGVAYERFTPTGPLALLPLGGGRCSLVWTHPPEAVDRLLEMDEATFLRHLGEAFGTRLGRFERVGRRVAYPLERQRANHDVQPRAVLVGNAAHTLHPVAGQGFNLALRDVAALAERLAHAARLGADPGDLALLEDYSAARRPDIDRVERDTDLLARLFVHRLPGLGHARAAGLAALELLPALRRRVAERGMGRGAVRARLAQGLPLTNHPT